MNENTRWIAGTGIVLLIAIVASVYTGVSHLTGLQTEMEHRLSENITGTGDRLAQRIERVDTRLTEDLHEVEGRLVEQIAKIDTGLRTVEGETATLAGVEARLTQTIEASGTRLAQGLQETEQRLTSRIDKIDDRLLRVEGESARLTAIVKSSWTPGDAIWPVDKETVAKVIAAKGLPADAIESFKEKGFDIEVMKALEESGISVQLFAAPWANPWKWTFIHSGTINALQNKLEKEAVDAAADAMADTETAPKAPAESE